MNRWEVLFSVGMLSLVPSLAAAEIPDRPNVLIVTLDDLGWDSLGVTGCKIPGITPCLDRLASEGVMFQHAHIMTSICGPSRNALFTGRYPHCSGSMGHGAQPPPGWTPPETRTPSICTYLHQRNYLTGCICKGGRLLEKTFDVFHDEAPFGVRFEDRDPDTFYKRTRRFIARAKAEQKPFLLYANPIDPHRPWPRTKMEADMVRRWAKDNPLPPAETQYDPDKVDVPAFLPDLPEVRRHIAPYYDSVRRGDECVGGILRALKESGLEENTIVFFLSDHGMAVPGGKWSSYYYSTRTPLIVRWPGKIPKGQVDDTHVVSSIDIVPTIVEAVGLPAIEGLEGRSLLPILQGKPPAEWRESTYAAFNYYGDSDQKSFYPVRVMTGRKYLYLWNSYTQKANPHSNFHGSNHELIRLMERLAKTHPELGRRAATFKHRPAEEFYDIEKDPGCWSNLVERPEYKSEIEELRKALHKEMTATRDPELGDFQKNILGRP